MYLSLSSAIPHRSGVGVNMAEYAHAQRPTNNAQGPGGEPACVPSTPEVLVCLSIRRSKRLASQAVIARDSTDPDPDDSDSDVDDADIVPRSPTQGVDGRGIIHHTSSTSTLTRKRGPLRSFKKIKYNSQNH